MKSASERLSGVLALALLLAACDQPVERAQPDTDGGAHAGAHAEAENATRCANCHAPEFRATTHPPHPNVRPTACGVCHTQTSWHGARIDHPGWELTGAHLRAAADKTAAGTEGQVKCFWCHREDVTTFKVKKRDCLSCHVDDHDKENEEKPEHAGFGTACQDCHSTEAWKPGKRPAHAQQADASAPEPEPHQGAKDAGAEAPKPKPKPPTPKPPPTAVAPPTAKPVPTPPDVISRPSRRH